MASEFAHPVEQALADVFDEHGIAWRYEPHTFVLERDADGEVSQAFTPDFFLPDLDLYVECTVMRQRLTSRKRRKVRLARERAGASIEIMFRRVFERLARRWGLEELAAATGSEARFEQVPARVPGFGMGESLRTLEVGDEFQVAVDETAGLATVTVGGDVDLHSAPLLRARLDALAEGGARHVLLDLSAATFLDSMALGVILAAKKRIDAGGGRLELIVSTPEVRRIFEITMLDQVLDIHGSRADAVRSDGAAG
jgi:anti-anti-sigma factor